MPCLPMGDRRGPALATWTPGASTWVDVVCDESVLPFYKRLGMPPLAGLAQRNYGAHVLRPRLG